MARLLLARGSRGALVEKLQTSLRFEARDIDGIYGDQTETVVREFQTKSGQNANGQIDNEDWKAITTLPVPELFERALQLTADFEGHGFTLAQGNFDGAGITWGIIGFTLKGGELSQIVLEVNRSEPDLIKLAFAELSPKLLQIMKAPVAKQIDFADSLSIGPKKTKLAEPWLSSFARFGELDEVQKIQLRRAREKYFDPVNDTAGRLGLITEMGIALCFDIHVQNGGVKKSVETGLRNQSLNTQRKRRVALANAVADSARPSYKEDVRSRKMTLATGSGAVHGAKFTVANWGIDEIQIAQ